jgi:WD40 repeat protein
MPPFDGDTSWDILAKIAESPPAAPRLLKPAIPRDLEIVCLTCLYKHPADRYPTAAALAEDLWRFLDGKPVVAAQLPWWKQAIRWAGKHRVVAGLILGVMLLLVGLLTTLLVARQVQLDANTQIASANSELSSKVVELSEAIGRADTHQKRAEAEAQRAREFGYVSDMELAASRWQLKRHEEVRRLLDRYTADPELKEVREFTWGYLNHQITADSEVIADGEQAYWHAAASPDGMEVALCGDRGEVHLLDNATRKIVHRFKIGPVHTAGVDYSPDGRWLAIAGGDSAIHFWDRKTRKVERIERVFPAPIPVMQVRFLPDSQVVWATSGYSPEWVALDLKSGKQQAQRLEAEATGCHCLFPSPDRRQMAFALGKGLIVKDTETQDILMQQPFDLGRTRAGIYSTDGHWLAVSTEPDTVRVYDTATYQQVHVVKTTSQPLVPAISSSGRMICGNFNGVIDEWNFQDVLQAPADQPLSPRTSWQAHDWTIQLVGFLSKDDSILSAGREGSIRRWIRPPEGFSRRIVGADSSAHYGGRPLSESHSPLCIWRATDNGCEEWNLQSGTMLRRVGAGAPIVSVSASEDHIYIVTEPGQLGVVPLDRPENIRWIVTGFSGPGFRVGGLEISPSRHTAVAWRSNPNLGEWINLESGTRTEIPMLFDPWLHHPRLPFSLIFYPLDGTFDAATLELPSFGVLKRLSLSRGAMVDAAFSKSGRYLVTMGHDSLVHVFHGETFEQELQLTGMPWNGGRLAISPDERTIAVAHEKGPVTLWHLPTGRHLAELPLPEEGPFPVRQVLFTSDGRHLVVCLDDRSIVAFDTRY